MAGTVEFEKQRRRLTLLAYRMCGRWTDAEDVVQNVAIEWLRTDADVLNPAGWLTRATVRRSIDALRARKREAVYVGPWLPEPLLADPRTDPHAELERSEAVSTAFLMLAESLTPPQRAVIVLRALAYEHIDIAEILDITPAASRQHHARGLRRLNRADDGVTASDSGTFTNARPDGETARLLAAFLAAAERGDVTALVTLLHDEVKVYQDGGGRTRAALRVIVGAVNVARFVVGVASRHEDRAVVFTRVNTSPGAVVTLSGVEHVISLEVRDGRIRRLFDMCNPDKQTTPTTHMCTSGRRRETVGTR